MFMWIRKIIIKRTFSFQNILTSVSVSISAERLFPKESTEYINFNGERKKKQQNNTYLSCNWHNSTVLRKLKGTGSSHCQITYYILLSLKTCLQNWLSLNNSNIYLQNKTSLWHVEMTKVAKMRSKHFFIVYHKCTSLNRLFELTRIHMIW